MDTLKIHTVGELAAYLQELLESDDQLHDCWVAGEVSNLSLTASGHHFFTIKDSGAQLRCVLFRKDAMWQTVLPENGKAIIAHGYVSIYEATGNLQFYTDLIQEEGQGALFLAYEQLKARLEEMGLFAPERKRPLPSLPRRIGIVTSTQAAALQDILNVISRRFPLAEVVFAPAQVQGDGAARQVAQAIAALNALDGDEAVDVIIVARGGGSIEDLWAFNEEIVARAVFASRAPVVSGVGHETDFTIVDYVADLRAPTPSAAAELVTPDRADLRLDVLDLRAMIAADMAGRIALARDEVQGQLERLERLSPGRQVDSDRRHVRDMVASMTMQLQHSMALSRERVLGSRARLEALSPLQILRRGYAIVRDLDAARVVTTVNDALAGHKLEIRVADGAFGARVADPVIREVASDYSEHKAGVSEPRDSGGEE